jgi:hypothetical protein
MKRYGPINITLEQVKNDYNNIVQNTHFINNGRVPLDDDLKPISSDMINVLMLLGTNGLHFLDKVLRSKAVDKFSEDDIMETYQLCDGFGQLSAQELNEINGGWDWSHVRDSSVEALQRAEDFAKQKIIEIYNNYKE